MDQEVRSAAGAGKWAVVLGASSGFGSAVSARLAAEGYNICGVHLDRRSTMPLADRAREAVEEAGVEALFFNVNAVDRDKMTLVLDQLEPLAGADGVSLLFHSLAFGSLAPLVGEDASASARDSQMAMTLNVMASSLVAWTQELAWRRLLGEGSRVMAMTSAGSTRAAPSYGMVSAAKAALEAYVRQLALELGPRGVAVNAIRAGVTDTPALAHIPGAADLKEHARSVNPGGRLTEPGDIAELVSLLMQPGGTWLTGNVLGVDGGEDIAAG
ncbi:MAG: SDR family oxidoreductase [Deltaproteobacteria bacterium]|nr:SDR family oxidoreductase [Deltaproteobacteria bacterium]